MIIIKLCWTPLISLITHRNNYGLMLLALCLSACQQPQDLSTIRFGLSAAPVTLDPRFATDAASSRINRLLYRSLTDFDDSLRPIPELATWQEISPTVYRFHLGQEGRQFHDGSQLTADDVKTTYDFILDEKNASPLRSPLTVIRSIIVRDTDTIEFVLNKPTPLFPGLATVGILPAKLITAKHPFNQKPIGSGQLKLVDWSHVSRLVLQRITDEQRIEFIEVKDPVVRALKLAHGELDLLQGELSPELVDWLEKRPGLTVMKTKGSNFAYLGFNLTDPITGQLAVRKAIAYALDREAIIHYLFDDTARAANNFMLPPHHWASVQSPGYSHDPKKARHLLAQAGFTEKQPVRLVYKTSTNPFRVRIASAIQQQLAEVGIAVDLKTYDWGTFYADIKEGRFQLFSLSWVGVKMPDIFHYAFHSDALPPQGANRGRLTDKITDLLIERAEQATSLEEQALFYKALQHYLFELLPYVPLWYEDQVAVIRDSIQGYRLASDGNYDGILVCQKQFYTVGFDNLDFE